MNLADTERVSVSLSSAFATGFNPSYGCHFQMADGTYDSRRVSIGNLLNQVNASQSLISA